MSGFIRRSLILAAAAFPMGLSLGASPAPAYVPAAIVVDKDAAPPAKDAVPQPATQPAKVAAPVPATGYSIRQIGDALRNMGYEPTEVKNNQGGYNYDLVFTRHLDLLARYRVLRRQQLHLAVSAADPDFGSSPGIAAGAAEAAGAKLQHRPIVFHLPAGDEQVHLSDQTDPQSRHDAGGVPEGNWKTS